MTPTPIRGGSDGWDDKLRQRDGLRNDDVTRLTIKQGCAPQE